MNPSYTVGTRRGSLGISAWRNIAHRTKCEPGPLFIEHWFKKRLPPTPTLQADFLPKCYAKGEGMTRAAGQIVGDLRGLVEKLYTRKHQHHGFTRHRSFGAPRVLSGDPRSSRPSCICQHFVKRAR